MTHYDYLIVGAGLFGSVFTYEAGKKGKKCLVIDKRKHIGGNVYTEDVEGIQVHKYGAHIFHTSNKAIWDYVNQLVEFNRYTNSPVAVYKDELYNLPFNMNTFHQLWGVIRPDEARRIIEEQKSRLTTKEPANLEEQAISLVGVDIYEKLVKGYTEKQWGKKASELPAFIIKRLPVRFTYDNNYFNDKYQGIPIGGYTNMITKMLKDADIRVNTDYFADKADFDKIADKVVFTGRIDEYFNYCYGNLDYRSLKFEEEILDVDNYQGNAVVNYTEYEIPYTRIIEHRHFDTEYSSKSKKTVITREYPKKWEQGDEPYYPVNDQKNMELYNKYNELKNTSGNTIFGGRLAEYKYYDMHNVIASALECAKKYI